MTRLLVPLALSFGFNCGSETAPTPSAPPSAQHSEAGDEQPGARDLGTSSAEPAGRVIPESTGVSDTVASRMQEHFASVMKVANAVVDGDLEAAQEAAAWFLENVTEEGLAAGWAPHVAQMREAARRVTTVEDLGAAADATGAMLVQCGACHRAVGVEPRFAESIEPTLRETAQAEMERHQWALGRLSEGLIGPSEHAWSAGAESLRAPPTCATQAAADVADVAVVHKLARDFDRLATRTRKTADFEGRGRLYGELLATCAACHRSGC